MKTKNYFSLVLAMLVMFAVVAPVSTSAKVKKKTHRTHATKVNNPTTENDIKYLYSNPTNANIKKWKTTYHNLCSKLITSMGEGYVIPEDMIKNEPCLVYLVLKAQSIVDEDKQQWFDLYNLMTEEHVYKLYDILYREQYTLNKN